MSSTKQPNEAPQKTAATIAKIFFNVGDDPASQKTAIRRLLWSAILYAGAIPSLFYFAFGEVSGLGWGLTIFFVAYCLLAAVGIYFRTRTQYHTTVPVRGNWADRIGSLWLLSCAFGPFLGWCLTAALPLTVDSWRWLYGLRLLLAAGVPVLTALPLTRYIRGKATWVALPLLVIVTLLPILSVVNVGRDLWTGAQRQPNQTTQTYLPYTQQNLDQPK